MFTEWTEQLERLIWGPLWKGRNGGCESFHFDVALCNLRPRFIPKGRVGRGFRAVARNGRILLAANRPLEALEASIAAVRIQPWRKVILPGEKPELFGILICARSSDPENHAGLNRPARELVYQARLSADAEASADLAMDVGGGMALVFTAQS